MRALADIEKEISSLPIEKQDELCAMLNQRLAPQDLLSPDDYEKAINQRLQAMKEDPTRGLSLEKYFEKRGWNI
ncbi:hypothetical protein [Roseibacillus persicicus]|uniref:hypothetical protein n=1 Tax=Roseibacillus persicicus TaxID=454148 RepID=UPI002810308D|nr:hypothetical protein [Roseibacillus persicicus]MDQ8191599.1 hypothetical protein [Roseibacillus persicicus]